MTVQGQFQVEGFEDLFKRMDEIREEVGKGKTDKIWREVMKLSMTPVLNAARASAPKDTGQLAKAIKLSVKKPSRKDKNSKYYQGEMYMAAVISGIKRDDTMTRVVLNKRGRFQNVVYNTRPVGVSQEFGNAHNAAHPYMRVSLERNMHLVMQIMEIQLKNVIDSFDKSKNVWGK